MVGLTATHGHMSSSPLLGPAQELRQAWADRQKDSEKWMEDAGGDEEGSTEPTPCLGLWSEKLSRRDKTAVPKQNPKENLLGKGTLLLWLPFGVLRPYRGGLWKVSRAYMPTEICLVYREGWIHQDSSLSPLHTNVKRNLRSELSGFQGHPSA